MHLRSDSFKPYDVLDARLAFGQHDASAHFAFAGNRNPHLAWDAPPEGTRSFTLLCVDQDAPSVGDDVNQPGRSVPVDLPRAPFYHWVLTDLPAALRTIAEGAHAEGITARGKTLGRSPDGGLHGLNDYTEWFKGHPEMDGLYAGYDGPAPPWNDERVHGYRFQLYALDRPSLGLTGAFTGADVLRTMSGHVLAMAELIGLYAIHPEALPRP